MAKRIHSKEFKTMIVKLVQSGQSVKQVSSDYNLHESMIRKWRKSYENNLGDFISKVTLTTEQVQIKNLEKQLREIRLERDILKKAVSIFSKSDR